MNQGIVMSKFGNSKIIKTVPPISTSIYAAGDVIGGALALNLAGSVSGRGVLKNISLFDDANQKAALTVLFFDGVLTGTYTDNAAPTISAADKAKFIGKVEFASADYTTVAGDAYGTHECALTIGSGNDPTAPPATRTVTVVIISGGTPTYAAVTDLQLALGFLGD